MQLSFPYIEIEGLRSFVRRTRIELGQAGPGLHFVKGINRYEPRLGSNGSGKSTIWDALTWCLKGRTLSGLTRPDLKPWYGDAETCVTVGVLNNKCVHRVSRRTGRTTIDDRTAGQPQIDELLGGMPLEVLGHAMLFAQGRPLFFDLEPAKKLKLFTTMLGLDRWDERSDSASLQVRKIDDELLTVAARLAALRSENQNLKVQTDRLQANSDAWEADTNERLENWQNELTGLRKDLAAVTRTHDDNALLLEHVGLELPPQQRMVDTMQKKLRDLQSRHEAWLAEMRTTERQLRDELDKLGSSDRCPLCNQSVRGTSLDKHRREIQGKLSDVKRKLLTDNSQRELTQLTKQLDVQIKVRDDFAAKLEAAHTAIDRLGPRKAEFETRIAAIQTQLNERADEHNPFHEQLRALQRRRRQICSGMAQDDETQQRLRRKQACTQFWVKGFKEVKLFQLEEVLEELELASNNMLGDAGLEDWSIRYVMEKQTKSGTTQRGLQVMILSPDNDDMVKWECWSGGEAQRLRIVGALGLSEVLLNHAGIEPGMLVLDEPSEHMSGEGIADICELLAERARRLNMQIWLADQNVIEGHYFASVMTVIKDKNGSKLLR